MQFDATTAILRQTSPKLVTRRTFLAFVSGTPCTYYAGQQSRGHTSQPARSAAATKLRVIDWRADRPARRQEGRLGSEKSAN